MSYIAINWTYKSRRVLDAGLKSTDLAVLRALCWLYRDEGTTRGTENCFPGVKRLAEMVGLKSGAVNAAKNRLKKKGLINWHRAANFPGRKRKTNVYTISCPALERKLRLNNTGTGPSEDCVTPLQPGVNYFRPDPVALQRELPESLSSEQIDWMSDALTFVGNRPESRTALLAVLQKTADLQPLRGALDRAMAISAAGRHIVNRLGYLLKAIRTAGDMV